VPLLNATISHAVENTVYYRGVLPVDHRKIETLDDVLRLPILTRQDIAEHTLNMVCEGDAPQFVRNTSGTTFGALGRNPLATFHSYDEQSLWHEVNNKHHVESDGSTPLMLRFLSIDHGLDLAKSPGMFQVPLEKMSHFHHTQGLLSAAYDFEGYSNQILGLVGTLSRIKLFTTICMDQNIDPKTMGLQFIGCHSQLLTDRWRQLLENYWGVTPTEYYGISEIPGLIGDRCLECGGYHLSPLAYIEMLDPETMEPVTSGPARLIATGLYPLIKTQPLIRYDSEDIVWLNDLECSQAFTPSFEYVGRAMDVLTHRIDNRTCLLVDPMSVHNILDSEPSIAVKQNDRSMIFGVTSLGFPKYKISHSKGDKGLSVHIDVELMWHPQYFPDRAAALHESLYEKLVAHTEDLPIAVECGLVEFTLQFLPPDSLDSVTEA